MPDDDEFAEFDFDEEEFEMKDDGRGGGKKQQQVRSMTQSQEKVKNSILELSKLRYIYILWCPFEPRDLLQGS